MKLYVKSILASALLAAAVPSFAGLTVGATRVVFTGDMKETSLSVMNGEDSSVFLIRSWVSSDNAGEKVPFMTTPPLFRIEPGQNNNIRINQTSSNLPQDKESVYWLNTLAIPPESKVKSDNSLQFSLNTRIKLFYRPTAINKQEAVDHAFEKVTFNYAGNSLVAKNPTPYFVNLTRITINGSELKEGYMVAPESSVNIKEPASSGSITWQAINDFGGLTEKASAKF